MCIYISHIMYIYIYIYIHVIHVILYIYIYTYQLSSINLESVWAVDMGIPEMQRSAQAIQVYDRICDFEGVKGSSEIQQKMTLGMSQIPTEMSMVFFHRSLSSSVVIFCVFAVWLRSYFSVAQCFVQLSLLWSVCVFRCHVIYRILPYYIMFSSHWLFSLGL